MIARRIQTRAALAAALCLGLSGVGVAASAQTGPATPNAGPNAVLTGDQGDLSAEGGRPTSGTERLERGLVAASTSEGVFLSWRLLAPEVTGHTDYGLKSPDFAVYRDGRRVAKVSGSTNYVDPAGTAGSRYRVVPLSGPNAGRSASATVWGDGHLDIPLNKPADGVTPAGEAYTYRANDASVADLDGDDEYEIVVKWDPSNSKDVSQVGYTGNVYLDAYELDGTQLWRIDLGVNIRAGAHYTQFPVYDFDNDGRAELMVKTAPGTHVTTYDDGEPAGQRYIGIPRDDRADGVTHADDYRMSAGDYYEHLVEMFRGWSTRPEVTSGEWPATLEEAWGIDTRWSYPLSDADARAAADHFIDVYAPARSPRNQLRKFEGFVVSGPEYLTVFDGRSGKPMETVDYEPGRTDDGLRWGDYAMARIEPGNRVDRFLSGVAYLSDGRPSAIFARGYYTRSTIAAYDWNGRHLTKRWLADSGWTAMTNPFNDSPHGVPGSSPEWGSLTTQGFHSLSVADVDADGKQEIIYGSSTLDDDGSLLYSSSATLPEGSANPGVVAGLGHGDAMHVTDIDPNRPGLEIWTCHEGGTWAPYGSALRDAATGEVLFGQYSGRDTGRAMIGDVRSDVPGVEVWASMPDGTLGSGTLSATGAQLSTTTMGTNQSVRWAGDGTTQIIGGAEAQTPTINDWSRGVVKTLDGTLTNNGTKGTPSLVADVLGDWREEVLVRTTDSSALRLFTTTEPTDIAMYTLMQDRQYRAEVARQQTTYNQPSYPGFYLASDTDWSTVPVPGRG